MASSTISVAQTIPLLCTRMIRVPNTENGIHMNRIILKDESSEKSAILHTMVATCMQDCLTKGLMKSPRVLNEIPDDLLIYNNPCMVGQIIQHVLQCILPHSQQHLIRITAKTYSDVILIHFRDADGLDETSIRPSLNEMKDQVEELGGFLDITSHRPSETTIAFSFPNLPDITSNLN
jgi:hypothetical protein